MSTWLTLEIDKAEVNVWSLSREMEIWLRVGQSAMWWLSKVDKVVRTADSALQLPCLKVN